MGMKTLSPDKFTDVSADEGSVPRHDDQSRVLS